MGMMYAQQLVDDIHLILRSVTCDRKMVCSAPSTADQCIAPDAAVSDIRQIEGLRWVFQSVTYDR